MPVALKDLGPEEKMELLQRHFMERAPLAELSTSSGIPVSDLDQWRRTLLERGAVVFRDDSIPVSLKFEFEQFAASACQDARIDGKDQALTTRNLVNQLEQDWLASVEDGLETEAARCRVYENFGSRQVVAACLRQPFWLRLLLYEDYRTHRMLIVLAFTFLLEASSHAKEFHQAQFYNIIVSLSPGDFVA